MSASREKKLRQEQAASGTPDPKKVREEEARAQQRRSNRLYGIIAAAFILVAAVVLIWNSNVIQRSATALTVDGEKYTAAQVDYFYHSLYNNLRNSQYASYMSLASATDLTTATLTDMDKMVLGVADDMTWDAYLKNTAADNIKQVAVLGKAAKEAGLAFTGEMQDEVNATLKQIKEAAKSNGVSVGSYIKAAFGKNMTMPILKSILKATTLAYHFDKDYEEKLVYSDDQLEASYAENAKSFDVVSYEVIYFTGSASSTTDADGNTVAPTEEESAAAKAKAKENAEEALRRYQAGESLKDIAESMDKASYSAPTAATYNSGVLGDWIFDPQRQEGDVSLLESDPNQYLAVFHERGRNDYNTVDVRHILFLADTSSLDAKSETYEKDVQVIKDTAKAKADDALAQWLAGERTEESFAALAAELSEDPGSKDNGGLYQEVYHNEMVQAFNDWIFDESRKVGDTDIVETNYGFHVMYFSGENIPYWKVQIRNFLRESDHSEWLNGLLDGVTVETASGMKYVG